MFVLVTPKEIMSTILFHFFLQSSLGCIEMHVKSALQATFRFYCCKTIYLSCNIWWLTVFVSSLLYQDIFCIFFFFQTNMYGVVHTMANCSCYGQSMNNFQAMVNCS